MNEDKNNNHGFMEMIKNMDVSRDKEDFEAQCPASIYTPAVLPKVKRLIVFGDIHGDYKLAILLLKMAKVIKKNGDDIRWIGGKTHIVQVGDQVDRCRPVSNMTCENKNATVEDEASDIKILEMFTDLDKQADIVGGRVISLLGNHELLNASGIMNYVSYKGLMQFNDIDDSTLSSTNTESNSNHDYLQRSRVQSGKLERIRAFRPGGKYGKFLACERMASIIIGSCLFLHAGIVPDIAEYYHMADVDSSASLKKINKLIRTWLLGQLKQDDVVAKSYVHQMVNDIHNSIFWTRILGKIPKNTNINDPQCVKEIKPILKMFKIGHIIIGHTPQWESDGVAINGACSNAILRADCGNSKAFSAFDTQYMTTGKASSYRLPQLLEVIDDKEFFVVVYKDGKSERTKIKTDGEVKKCIHDVAIELCTKCISLRKNHD